MKDVDIYFLTLNSKIPEILSAALSNYIIVSTLRYDKNEQLSTLSATDRLQHSYVSISLKTKEFIFNFRMDTTMIKFTQLKTEILQSLRNPHQLTKLTDELSNACNKYSKVKELFWKVDFNFYIFLVFGKFIF
jgi:hypothetical protein